MTDHPRKILLTVPGHLKTVPMNRFVYETLVAMGHRVELFDLSAGSLPQKIHKGIARKHFYTTLNRRLLSRVETFRPDLLFSVFGFDLFPETLQKISKGGTLTACWWLNDPFQYRKSIRQAPYYDHYFTNAHATVEEYRRDGIEKVHYLPVGIFSSVHRKLPGISKKYDILFAGDYSELREQIITELLEEFDVAVVGPWKKLSPSSPVNGAIVRRSFFTPEEMNRFFNEARIVLNIHTWMNKSTHGINPRLFEACGSGSFQLTDNKEDIPLLFEIGKELDTYETIGELKEKLRYYLSHEKEREHVAAAGYERVLREHTYRHRMEQMLSTVFETRRSQA